MDELIFGDSDRAIITAARSIVHRGRTVTTISSHSYVVKPVGRSAVFSKAKPEGLFRIEEL